VQEAQAWAKQHGREFRGIIRLVGRDLPGELTVTRALPRIKGIGHNLSASLVQMLVKQGVSQDAPVGALNESEVARVEDVIKNPGKHGVPSFLLNRAKDPDTGLDRHLLAADLTFAVRQDVDREKENLSYRGWRHSIGQKTRGQHTRSTGRSGMTVGVLKKAVKAQKAAAATGAQEKSAPKAEAKK
jgi:small subunit ribosomal protein S13